MNMSLEDFVPSFHHGLQEKSNPSRNVYTVPHSGTLFTAYRGLQSANGMKSHSSSSQYNFFI
jgi:hypothetical protein